MDAQHNEPMQVVAGHPDNPEPHHIKKDSFSSKSNSRKSSSNSADNQYHTHEQQQTTLHNELAEVEGHNYDLTNSHDNHTTKWTKNIDQSGQQNGDSSTTVQQISMLAQNEGKQLPDHEQYQGSTYNTKQQPRRIIELSQNVYVQELNSHIGSKTEEYQVYTEGSKIVLEQLDKEEKRLSGKASSLESDSDKVNKYEHQHQQEQKPIEQEYIPNYQYQNQHHKPQQQEQNHHHKPQQQQQNNYHKPQQQQNQYHKPQQQVEHPDHHPYEPNKYDAPYNEEVEAKDNTEFTKVAQLAIQPEVLSDHNKKSVDKSHELEEKPIESELIIHNEPVQPQLTKEFPSYLAYDSRSPSAIVNPSQQNVENPQSSPNFNLNHETGLSPQPKTFEEPVQKIIEPEHHNEQELLRDEVDSAPKKSYIDMIPIPVRTRNKEQKKGQEGESCKCSIM